MDHLDLLSSHLLSSHLLSSHLLSSHLISSHLISAHCIAWLIMISSSLILLSGLVFLWLIIFFHSRARVEVSKNNPIILAKNVYSFNRSLPSAVLLFLYLLWHFLTPLHLKVVSLVFSIIYFFIESTWLNISYNSPDGSTSIGWYYRGQFSTFQQFYCNMLYIPILITLQQAIPSAVARIIIFPLQIWLLEIIEGYFLILLYGLNPAWNYNNQADARFHGLIKLNYWKYWLLMGIAFELLLQYNEYIDYSGSVAYLLAHKYFLIAAASVFINVLLLLLAIIKLFFFKTTATLANSSLNIIKSKSELVQLLAQKPKKSAPLTQIKSINKSLAQILNDSPNIIISTIDSNNNSISADINTGAIGELEERSLSIINHNNLNTLTNIIHNPNITLSINNKDIHIILHCTAYCIDCSGSVLISAQLSSGYSYNSSKLV
jgi:hypothetical protein